MLMVHRPSPEYVLIGLLGVYAYEKVRKRIGRANLTCQWFFFMLPLLFYFMCSAVSFALGDVILHTNFLDPMRTAQLVRDTMVEDDDLESFMEWQSTSSLAALEWLRWLSLLSPVWVVLTFGICWYHTVMHAAAMRRFTGAGGGRVAHPSFKLHERTIRVIFLPCIYGLMSLYAVNCMWCIIINHSCGNDPGDRIFSSWLSRVDYFSEVFEASFAVADIYESYALLILAHIIMTVLKGRVVPSMEHKDDGRGSPFHARSPSAVSVPSISASKLMLEMKELTTFGIKLFCWTCGLQAVYQVVVTTLGYHHVWERMFGTEHSSRGVLQTPLVQIRSHYFFLGAGFVASFAAIGNVVKVETAFHSELDDFGPFWKFWGTKVIVSIAFMQSVGLKFIPPFCWWSATRVNLFYASALCLECFLVSLLHLKAWGHEQTWYVCEDLGLDEETTESDSMAQTRDEESD